MKFSVGLCVILCDLIGIIQATNVTVSTDIGTFIGQTESLPLADNTTRSVIKFLGIPFAEPPVGNLRFSKPVPKASFTKPYEAFQYGPSCIQTAKVDAFGLAQNQNEDCLTLNIFTPAVSGSYPVMIFIYGGAFANGGSSIYPGQVLSSYGDVLVVTINYRLGPFGFLSTDDDYVPGNAGLWDQHLAIKWVSQRIAQFGGDVSRITIFGESAGAVSVGLQSIFMDNSDLFHRAVMQSGSPNLAWGISGNGPSVRKLTALAREMNCQNTEDRRKMVECLRAVTDVANLALKAADHTWSPRIDGKMITQEAINSIMWPSENIVQSAFNKYDFLIGTNTFEGYFTLLYQSPILLQAIENGTKPAAEFAFRQLIQGFFQYIDPTTPVTDELVSAVMFQYSDVENPNDRHYFLKKVNDFFTDLFFALGAYKDLLSHSFNNNQTKTYHYEYNHKSVYSYPGVEWLTGATHGDELAYLFGLPLSILNSSETQVKVSQYLIDYWTNFAKTANPNTPKVVPTMWKEYDSDDKYYLHFPTGAVPEVRQRLDAKRMLFWMDYYPKLIKNPPKTPCESSTANSIQISITWKFILTTFIYSYLTYFSIPLN